MRVDCVSLNRLFCRTKGLNRLHEETILSSEDGSQVQQHAIVLDAATYSRVALTQPGGQAVDVFVSW